MSDKSRPVRWGIIGPGNIANNFAQGLAECESGALVAVASRDQERGRSFAAKHGAAQVFDTYGTLIASDDIDAVYVATPHPFHAQIALNALRTGKHVVVEKPAGLVAGEVTTLTEAARQQGRFLMEGFMYRCHPQITRLVALLRAGIIGDVVEITTSFGFTSTFDPTSRLYDPDLAGGAILDVGLYPVSLARLVAGVAAGGDIAEPIKISGTGTLAMSGVDDEAHALFAFEGGVTAHCSTSVRRALANDAVITGSKGKIRLADPWTPGRNAGPSDATIEVTVGGKTKIEQIAAPQMLFAHEAEVASRAILDGLIEAKHPAATHRDSIGNAHVLDKWRAELGYVLPGETAASVRRLAGTMPANLPDIPHLTIPGADHTVSALIMGCDNRDTIAEGAIVWDAWWEAGGNGFDTGFVYGGGLHEMILGDWMKARGVAAEAQVIVKGAHSPYCLPQVIEAQLDISLERLGLDKAPIYIMHRDNPDIPVGEFMEVLNVLQAKGRIGAIGGSNWSVARFEEANEYSARHGLNPLTILNNNLSLAVMERPVWPGCISSNNAETLAYLRRSNTAHLSWSSQARGYFLQSGEGTTLDADTRPDVCFSSKDNAERRRRAAELAGQRGVTTHAIATAWVLGQSFPSAALIGPRTPGEIASTLTALSVRLSPDECAWLNLEK
jgi:predicted dehydrogenase/aryl-alcohol dehydrogenase-like predicted oxidoreductase